MKKTLRGSAYLLVIGGALFLFLGVTLLHVDPLGLADFKQIYYGAKCLVAHRDPYRDSDLWSVYRMNGGTLPKFLPMAPHLRVILSQSTNLPFTLLILVPFTFLPWTVASMVWVGAIAASFLLASYLVWRLSAPASPGVAGGLLLLLLANSTLLLSTGNAAGLVVSFAVIATWAILRDRYALAGPILLALSLAIKPHDSWLILVYFFLAGGALRRRAWQTFAIASALTLISFLWISHLVPNWPHELHSNLVSSASPGGARRPRTDDIWRTRRGNDHQPSGDHEPDP